MKFYFKVIVVFVSFTTILICSANINPEQIMTNNMESEISSTVEHKVLKKDGYNIHYYVFGNNDSDLIVMLHPAFSDHRAFGQQVEFFSKNYKVITIDLVGHGLSKANKSKDKIDSSANHINEIIEIEGYKKAHLVGVSVGALIAQYFALNYPDKTKSLTALGGYNINKDNKEVEKAQRSSNLGLIFRAVFSMKSFKKKTAEISCRSENGQALFYNSCSHYERKSFMVMQGLQNIIKDRKTIEPKYSTLILTGEYDIELAKEMAKEWHSTINNSKFLMIKDAGHCANMDKPLEFNQIVKQFIEENN